MKPNLAEIKPWLGIAFRLKNMEWEIDRILLHNQNCYLLHKGGKNGIYAELDMNSSVSPVVRFGTYKGKLEADRITNAIFEKPYCVTYYGCMETPAFVIADFLEFILNLPT